jgi:hypothetical protein
MDLKAFYALIMMAVGTIIGVMQRQMEKEKQRKQRNELAYAIAWTVAFSLFGDGYIHAYTDPNDTGYDLEAHMTIARSSFAMHHQKRWTELGLNTAMTLAKSGSAAYTDDERKQLAQMRELVDQGQKDG